LAKPLKEEVHKRERAVADLEAQAKLPKVGGRTPGDPIRDSYGRTIDYRGSQYVSSDPESAQLSLPHAREQLARAKEALLELERQAGRDGIAPGQLY
jgi:hypothetical protein